ncbi:protein RoBo-1-like [Marmota marmota marmota]|uniref:protein RoBo-1-like n=1 Tax=Marmota marmota marmota TaxID=9994 RepID=UPI002092B397|nr:protein RoBo-1-like [Marmota marmota marmota]
MATIRSLCKCPMQQCPGVSLVTSVQASTLRSLSTLCIFVALVFSTVESYTCTKCTGNACQSKPETCEASQGCFNNKQQFSPPDGSPKLMQTKGCSQKACTPLAFSATLGRGQILGYDMKCCYHENCNQGNSELSPVSKEENGVVCPACFSENGMICIPQPLKCTGAETKCLEIKGVTGGNPPSIVSAMGCTTESACKLGTIELNYELEFDCVKPISGSPLLTPIISSTLTSLLLLKVLL